MDRAFAEAGLLRQTGFGGLGPTASRLDGAGLVRRGQLVAPPLGATVLARFSDGVPAVARVGNITFATSDQSRDWSPWIQEEMRIDWATTKDSSKNKGDGR